MYWYSLEENTSYCSPLVPIDHLPHPNFPITEGLSQPITSRYLLKNNRNGSTYFSNPNAFMAYNKSSPLMVFLFSDLHLSLALQSSQSVWNDILTCNEGYKFGNTLLHTFLCILWDLCRRWNGSFHNSTDIGNGKITVLFMNFHYVTPIISWEICMWRTNCSVISIIIISSILVLWIKRIWSVSLSSIMRKSWKRVPKCLWRRWGRLLHVSLIVICNF